MIFCGLVGPEGVGKTGIVLDSMTDEKKRGDVIFVLDFDGGGMTTVSLITENMRRTFAVSIPMSCLKRLTRMEKREIHDYPATHRRVMKIGQTLVDWAARPGDKPRLHSVLITAVDLWDEVAKNCMFIEDLGTAPDGIGPGQASQQVGLRFNWQIRTTRFHQLTPLLAR